MPSPSFQADFNAWLDAVLARTIPGTVVAFCFNLSEPWRLELVGAGSFSAEDDDWACDEVFTSRGNDLDLPEKEVGCTWEEVLASAKTLLVAYLGRNSPGSAVLKSRNAVAVGFVDGELEVLWQK